MTELSVERPNAYRWTNDPLLLFCGVAAALLLTATVKEQALGFYTFLRIYVCCLSLILGWHFWRQQKFAWMLLAAVAATLFNPVLPVELEQDAWQWFDLAAAGGFIWVAVSGLARSMRRPRLMLAVLVPVALLGVARVLGDNWPQSSATVPGVETMSVENIVKDSDASPGDAAFGRAARSVILQDKCGGLYSQDYSDALRALRTSEFAATSGISLDLSEKPACLKEYCKMSPNNCPPVQVTKSSETKATALMDPSP